ncbi:MAG: tetratricopeptide repeat protein, partial [bacterium]
MSIALHICSRRRGPDERRFRVRWTVMLSAAATMAMVVLPCLADEQEVATASLLMEKGQYPEAIKALGKAVERQGDDASPAELRMLGENYYQLKDFGNARTYYARALPRQTSQKATIICESRLAIIDYRLGDMSGAGERIANFIRNYPTDDRVGPLSVIRIRILQNSALPPAEKIRKMQDEYDRMIVDKEKCGYYNVVLAAQSLGDQYIEVGEEQKAAALFVSAVHQMRSLVVDEKKAKRDPSPELLQGVDGMALQLAKLYMGRKDWAEAQKWLENVTYVEDMVAQAKYLLAQIYYRN